MIKNKSINCVRLPTTNQSCLDPLYRHRHHTRTHTHRFIVYTYAYVYVYVYVYVFAPITQTHTHTHTFLTCLCFRFWMLTLFLFLVNGPRHYPKLFFFNALKIPSSYFINFYFCASCIAHQPFVESPQWLPPLCRGTLNAVVHLLVNRKSGDVRPFIYLLEGN